MVHSQAEIEAVDWLAVHTAANDTVLASYDLGGYIPARTGHRSFAGHWAETVDVTGKKEEIERFYATADHSQRRRFLDEYGLRYVVFGPREQELGDFSPENTDYLIQVFGNDDVNIYRVQIDEKNTP
jgi:uncharacterized membrane protein